MKYVILAAIIGFSIGFIVRTASAETLETATWNRYVCEQVADVALTVKAPYFTKLPLDAPVCFGRL